MSQPSQHPAMRAAQPASRDEWNTALAELPYAHVLQTWEWGAFKARHGWQPIRTLWRKQARPCAAALLLVRRLGFWPASVVYVPKGPALDYADGTLLDEILGHLESTARRARALFVKIDPDVQPHTTAGAMAVETLRRRGWRASGEQIQFRNTIEIDLERGSDELLAAMKPKWRYNVRLAQRKGVTVRRGTPADLPLLYCMYAETAARDGFVIRPEPYYHDAWGSFFEAGLAQPLIAEVEGEAVAMVILFHFAESTWYMFGASSEMHRDRMPNHLLQWEAIRWAQEQGCSTYDMWGAPEKLEEADPLWGVYRFKQGFGGEFAEHIGAWDFPSQPGYWFYSVAMPRVLSAMRQRHWRQKE